MMRISGAAAVLLLAAAAIAGCSGSKKEPSTAIANPDIFPANYRNQIATLLLTNLKDPADFRGALIGQPTLKPVGDSRHYIVCVQLNGRGFRKDKVAIYLGGSITQYIDATPEQCADAAYQPFRELDAQTPSSAPMVPSRPGFGEAPK